MLRLPARRALVAAATVAAAALALTACTGQAADGPVDAGGTPDPDATLRVGLVLEPTSLDIRRQAGAAGEQALIGNVYEGLVGRTEKNKVEPLLASDYTVSDDGLVYTFTLRQGVKFHNGSEMTATDAAASIAEVVTDEEMADHDKLANVVSVGAPDPSTVRITLGQPDQNLLFTLTGPAGLVFDAEDSTDLKTDANGTGPFSLAEWNQGENITLDRFDDYWGDKAGVEEAVLSYIPDFTAGVNAALDGSLDVLTAVDPQLAPQLDGADGFTLTTGQTTDKAVLAFNNALAPLDDPKVREALRLAIDHDALVAAVGAGKTQYGPIPALDPGYQDLSDVAPYDPERAKKLLADAGAKDLELTLTIPSFYGTTVSTYLVSAFDDIGVTLKVKPVEFSTWLNDVYTNKDYQLSFVLHVEPRDFDTWADPSYYYNYDNAQVQELYAQAEAELDPKESAKLLAKAAKLVSEDHPADWLYTGETITAVGPGVAGFPVDSINSRIDLAGVTLSD